MKDSIFSMHTGRDCGDAQCESGSETTEAYAHMPPAEVFAISVRWLPVSANGPINDRLAIYQNF